MKNELIKPDQSLKGLLHSQQFSEQVTAALPSHIAPAYYVRVATTALTRTPKLMECTQQSFFRCLLDCASFGLLPDGRHAHLIPYGKDCTLILDYKGLIALAKRSGDVKSWAAELVCEADNFSWKDGKVSHEIDWRRDRGEIQCVYSRVELADGTLDFEVMTLAEVRGIQKRSKAGSSGPWITDFGEMAKKTVIRRHSKRLTLSPEFTRALDRDDDRIEKTTPVPSVASPINPFAAHTPEPKDAEVVYDQPQDADEILME